MNTPGNNEIYQYTDQKLLAHYQNNQEFNRQLAILNNYYYEPLLKIVKIQDKTRLESELFASIKGQIFNGYFMVQELLANPEITIDNEWFAQTEGMITQQIPSILKDAIGENYEEVITDHKLKKLAGWLISEYEGVYPLLMDISLNSACFGANWALLDESVKRNITIPTSQNIGLLGYVDDLTFISPQHYIQCISTNNESEMWEILNSRMKDIEKIGEVVIFRVSTEMENVDNVLLNLYLSEELSETEQKQLINIITAHISTLNNIELNQILIRIAIIKDFFEYNNR
jgi:hypothetical protein